MTSPNWDAWQYLIGEWIGEGGGQPGQGGSVMTFEFDLQRQVLLRRNHMDFIATKDRPAFAHDDLTVIHPDEGGTMRGTYYDNEGHIIQYTVSPIVNQDTIIFISDPLPAAPRFRNTYLKGKNGTVLTRFEIAPPGNPEGFAVYVEGVVKKK
jgi:hypothetical protein